MFSISLWSRLAKHSEKACVYRYSQVTSPSSPFWCFRHAFSISGILKVAAHNFMKSRENSVMWWLSCKGPIVIGLKNCYFIAHVQYLDMIREFFCYFELSYTMNICVSWMRHFRILGSGLELAWLMPALHKTAAPAVRAAAPDSRLVNSNFRPSNCMQGGVFSISNDINLFLMIFPCVSIAS